jgi:vacuolar-type H+-ATPase subunit I/STV1
MNFDYSYRAFLITSLLFGILFLTLYTFKLGSGYKVEELSYDVEYLEEEPELTEEELAQLAALEQRAIETNKAYNEAARYLSDLENSESDIEEKLAEIDDAIGDTNDSDTAEELRKAKERIRKAREIALKKKAKNNAISQSSNRNTTISYLLNNRKAIYLPNPVYTCDRGGIIVINITVNSLGKVVKADYNKKASSTDNGCLIDSALEYAAQARFNTDSNMEEQIGTITYNFPGQY